MKIALSNFRLGLKKAFGIVNSANNYEYLQSFYLKPTRENGGGCYLAGSDGTITFLAKVPAILDENDKEEMILIPAKKLFSIATYSTDDIEIKDGDYVTITSGRTVWKITKYGNEYLDNLPFNELDSNEYDDEFEAKELGFILNSLLPTMAGSNTLNTDYRLIYLDGEKAYTSDSIIVSYINCKTNKPYILQDRVVRCMQDLLLNYSGQVKFRYTQDETMVLVSLTDEVFLFKLYSSELLSIDETMQLPTDSAVLVFKSELINSLNKVLVSAEENDSNIYVSLGESEIELHSENSQGEDCYDFVTVYKSKIDGQKKLKILANYLLRIVGIVKEEFVIIRYSMKDTYITVSDKDKRYCSFLMAQ